LASTQGKVQNTRMRILWVRIKDAYSTKYFINRD